LLFKIPEIYNNNDSMELDTRNIWLRSEWQSSPKFRKEKMKKELLEGNYS